MNKYIYLILCLSLLSGCKAWDASMMAVTKDPIDPKLLSLERQFGDYSNTTVIVNSTQEKLFTEEVEKNLIDPYGDKYGYIVFKSNVTEFKGGMGLLFLSSFTAFIPNLFGMPMSIYKYKVETEFRILDRNHKLIGKYSAVGEAKNKVALYYGYNMGDCITKTYYEALNNSFNNIRPQIVADTQRLNKLLKEAGKI